MSRRAAVLGSPIRHSLSPLLHRAAYAELGLDWTYDAFDVDQSRLGEFLAGLDESWAGLSLTMPLKRAVIPMLDAVSQLADDVAAVNTVVFAGGRREGHNTDVPGMVAAVRAAGVTVVEQATVLGGGATAAAALAAVRDLGVTDPTVVVRRPGAVGELLAIADRLGVRPAVLSWDSAASGWEADLIIATTPAGATDALADGLPPAVRGVLLDVVYDPWPTPLASAWAARSAPGRVLGGIDLLVHQAALQVRLMTGREVSVDRLVAVMRAAVAA
jgi:shikimate dehydrogenase